MKILYQNYICENEYVEVIPIPEYDDYDYVIGSKRLTTEKTNILLYDSDQKNKPLPIYLEFAYSDSLEKATTFYQKYGAFINGRLAPSNDIETHSFYRLRDIHYVLEASLNDKSINQLYDYVIYKHFCYYRLQMECLIEIHRLINLINQKFSDDSLRSLVTHCHTLLSNPYFEDMLLSEYENLNDFDQYCQYFSYNPFMEYLYFCNLPDEKEYLYFFNLPDKKKKKNNLSLDKELKFANELLEMSEESLTHSYLVNHKQEILSLARYLFAHALSSVIHDVHIKVDSNSSGIVLDWYFPSLVSAIFFYFFIDSSSSNVIDRCANDLCQKLFIHSGSHNVKYCCPECAHRVASRNYKQRRANKPS